MKDKGGRPRKEIDYEVLKKLCGVLCTGEECSSILGIDYDTLNNHLKDDGHGGFSDYFKKHSARGKASLRRMQFKSAECGNAAMLIWLGKQHLDQSEPKTKIDLSSEDGTMTPQGFNDFYTDDKSEP